MEQNYACKQNWGRIIAYDVNLKGPYKYDALQFHFHAPSENFVNGTQYDLEIHIVHVAEDKLIDKPYAVLTVLFKM